MTFPIYQVDAFASEVFKGNPAAVVPLQDWLPAEQMLAIARENNLSETAFLVKGDAAYHIRWFTPGYEIDLCGHATLASAYVIKNFLEPHVQDIHFTTEKAGDLRTTIENGLYVLDFPARMPEPCTVPPHLLESLGVSTAVEVLRSRDYFVVLPNEEAVLQVEPDFNLMKQIDTVGVIVTAKGHERDVVSRCFYPGAGVNEDPVTGSAHCNIVPYWSGKLNKTKMVCYQASARGGELHGSLQNGRVLMGGSCVLYLEGKITV